MPINFKFHRKINFIQENLLLLASPSSTIHIRIILSQHQVITFINTTVEFFNRFLNIFWVVTYVTLFLCLTGRRCITKKICKNSMPTPVRKMYDMYRIFIREQ